MSPEPMAAETRRLTGGEYMELLEQRRAAWEAECARSGTLRPRYGALLEWFVQDGDEKLFTPPKAAPVPKRETKPRVYRSAASLREERDQLQARRAAFVEPDNGGPEHDARAIVNVSTQSKNRASRASGRRRHASNDRALREYAALTRRIGALNSQIVKAEAREAHAATPEGTR
jgi:hypothetical protein